MATKHHLDQGRDCQGGDSGTAVAQGPADPTPPALPTPGSENGLEQVWRQFVLLFTTGFSFNPRWPPNTTWIRGFKAIVAVLATARWPRLQVLPVAEL